MYIEHSMLRKNSNMGLIDANTTAHNDQLLGNVYKCTFQWWSLETWSRSRDPFLRVSVSKVSGLVSVSKVSGLETLSIAKKWFIKIYIIQRFCLLYLQVRNNQNISEKCQKLKKN